MELELNGKVAIVAGGSKGIAAALLNEGVNKLSSC